MHAAPVRRAPSHKFAASHTPLRAAPATGDRDRRPCERPKELPGWRSRAIYGGASATLAEPSAPNDML
jgi:hypothetical protein